MGRLACFESIIEQFYLNSLKILSGTYLPGMHSNISKHEGEITILRHASWLLLFHFFFFLSSTSGISARFLIPLEFIGESSCFLLDLELPLYLKKKKVNEKPCIVSDKEVGT